MNQTPQGQDGPQRITPALPVIVRRAEDDELGAVGELTVRGYAAGVPSNDPYAETLRDAAGRSVDSTVLVAVDQEGVLLGTATWCPEGSSGREIAAPGEGEFRMLTVAPEARGHRIGEAMVEHILGLARENGDTAVVLSSSPWMTTAHAMYERLGFSRTPDRDWDPRPGLTLRTYRLALEPHER